jgi:hypothetical protein
MRMSSLLTPIFEHKKHNQGSKKVHQKTRAFLKKLSDQLFSWGQRVCKFVQNCFQDPRLYLYELVQEFPSVNCHVLQMSVLHQSV